MRFVKSVKPAAAAISLISAGIPKSLDISSPSKSTHLVRLYSVTGH